LPQLLVAFALLTFLVLGFLSYVAVSSADNAVAAQVRSKVLAVARLQATTLSVRVQSLKELTVSVAARPPLVAALGNGAVADRNLGALQQLLGSVRGLDPEFQAAAVFDPAGRLVAVSPPIPALVGKNSGYQDWYRNVVRSGAAYVSQAFVPKAPGAHVVVGIAAPVRSVPPVAPRVIGYMVFTYGLSQFQGFATSIGGYAALSLTVTDQAGHVLVGATAPTKLVSVARDPRVRRALSGASGTMTTGSGAHKVLSGFAPVPGAGWAVHADVLGTTAFAPVSRMRAKFGAVGAAFALVLLVTFAVIARVRRRRAQAEQSFRALADTAPIGILDISQGAAVNYANPRIAEISGRPTESLMGRGWTDVLHPDDAAELLEHLQSARPGSPVLGLTCRVQRPDGEVRHVRISAAWKGQETDGGCIMSVEDVTETVRAQGALAHQAFHDSLTGLPNRSLFLDRLCQELAQRRRSNAAVAVLFLDLDRFKVVNDSLGHEAGDAVLKELGRRFLRTVRAGETAARFGGDEFMFIIREERRVLDAAVTSARRLLHVLESPVGWGGHDLVLTGSIGIVVPRARDEATAILRDADTAMYKAKTAGGNCFQVFDDNLHRTSVARFAVESELRRALERHEFRVYYQPIVEPGSGRPVGAEALARWCHPTRGIVLPQEFIPVAEESGLIKPIGNWVFGQAVSQSALWDAQPDGPRLDVLSVNVAPRQLNDPEISDKLRSVVQDCSIDPSRIVVEVTESAVMSDSPSTRRSLGSFRALGVGVAIDDFGTGYSSLAYLHTLPVTTIKVDRSFIERLGSADDSTPVVKAIIDMGHAMGLDVVAEGVSDEHLRVLVTSMGCELAQGFLWSPPLPAEEFVTWWREVQRQACGKSSRSPMGM
jgi:diguanylate cyclase (GGDEF)-like protein/PAS domain S-box-containing protein